MKLITGLSATALFMTTTIILTNSASAAIVKLNITWSGASFGNGATATGILSIDDSALPTIGRLPLINLPNAAVTALSITISGPYAGNRAFGISSFGSIYFQVRSELNFGQELIGQIQTNGCAFGTSTGPCGNGLGGDFNLFSNGGGAPSGTYYFRLTTADGENMLVTSMTAVQGAVPEPASWALMLGGFGLIGAAMRRRQSVRVTYA
jgi:PEP-CTERM motif